MKYCTLIGSFCPMHIKIQMKKYRRVSLMKLKSDAKFEEKLTLDFELTHEKFSEFYCKQWVASLKIFFLIATFVENM